MEMDGTGLHERENWPLGPNRSASSGGEAKVMSSARSRRGNGSPGIAGEEKEVEKIMKLQIGVIGELKPLQ